jgi:peptidase M23B
VNYRKEQVSLIQTKTQQIKDINQTLVTQRDEKNKVLAEQRREQAVLQQEKRELEQLAANIRTVERNYESQIREKQQQATAIDREIQRLIRLAIIEANKRNSTKANNSVNTTAATPANTPANTNTTSDSNAEITFVLTPESRRVANSFEANKGNLIWPVAKGYKSQGFGVYYDPVYPELQHYNNGVTIATEKGAEARCVFEGEVSAIQSIPGSNKVVQVRHGNYITIYYNLTEVYVKKGDKVKAKDSLGKIFTNGHGKTEMKFFLYKNTTRLNPEFWIHKM